jgi:integrase
LGIGARRKSVAAALAEAERHLTVARRDLARVTRAANSFNGDGEARPIPSADRVRALRLLIRGDPNRFRDQLSGMFKRAVRLGLLTTNPVKGIPKVKPGGRVLFLGSEEEDAVRAALPEALRPPFTVSVNTGLRWSEQAGLEWRDVDMLSGIITVRMSKNGSTRRVPMNSVVRAALVGVAADRRRPADPTEPVFTAPYRTTARAIEKAAEAARATLTAAGKDSSRLDGYTWHGNRHTFASRLVASGADLRMVQELGGWKTLTMVQRYAHLAPERLVAAVERLVSPAVVEPGAEPSPVGPLRRNFGDGETRSATTQAGVS